MRGRRWLVPCAVLLLITLVCFLWYQSTARTRDQEDRDIAASKLSPSNSGTQFLIEGQPVNVEFTGESDRVRIGDALGVNLVLKSFALSDTSGLANEHAGQLEPSLILTGCNVSSIQANPQPTTAPIPAFSWHWSVVCTQAGEQDLQVTLAFHQTSGDPNGSDPIAYRYSQKFEVIDRFTLNELSAILSVLTGVVTLLSGALALFRPGRTADDGPKPTA